MIMAAVAGKKLDPNKCPICGIDCGKRLTKFEEHLIEAHATTSQQQWDLINDGPRRCRCGCGQITVWLGWKHGYGDMLRGHNSNLVAVYDEEKAKEISNKRRQSLLGTVGWSKGLTKESDERIRRRAEATSKGRRRALAARDIKIWSKGLTKETDERIARQAQQTRDDFAAGVRRAWHKDSSEALDPRLKKKNDDLRRRYADGSLVPWHKGLTADVDPRLTKFWRNRDAIEEFAHLRWSDGDIRERLQSNTQLRLERIDTYKNDRTPALWIRCSNCDWFEKTSLIFARGDRCPRCAPIGSQGQHEVADWLASEVSFPIGRNVKGIIGRRELDIYVPSHKLAIEYNGLYWHSELAGRDNKYHNDKSRLCADLGIRLFHVFEDEWRDKQEIVKSMIKHRLGLTPLSIGARTCKVGPIDHAERRAFLDANHIDGDTKAAAAFGLRSAEHGLVMVMSLRRPFHKKHSSSDFEVARLAGARGVTVPGGIGRLTSQCLKWAQNEGKTGLLSYVDTRHGGDHTGWMSGGWTMTGTTESRFWWTDFENRFNRFRYRADKSRNMTEAQIAEEAGVVKIWGCGNLTMKI